MNESKNIEQRIDAYFNGSLSTTEVCVDALFYDAYFNGSLSTTEVETLMAEIAINEDAKTKFMFAKEVFEAILDKDAIAFEADLARVIKEGREEPTVSIAPQQQTSSKRRLIYMLSAAACFVLLFGVWQIFSNESPSTQQLYAQNYATYIHSTPRGDSTIDWQKVFALYSEGKYVEFIDQVEVDKGNHRMQDFYLAMSYMETKQWEKAKQLLKQLTDVRHPQFTDASIWYLALANLQTDDIEEAKSQLQRLNEFKGGYARKAKKLSQELK